MEETSNELLFSRAHDIKKKGKILPSDATYNRKGLGESPGSRDLRDLVTGMKGLRVLTF